jgi:hypothetical protein
MALRLYALTFWMHQYVVPSITSWIHGTRTELDIVIGDNTSENSGEIERLVLPYVGSGKVSAFFQFRGNLYTAAFEHLYRLCPPPADAEWVVFTESDVVWKREGDWVEELSMRMRNPKRGLVGFDLDLENYGLPQCKGHLTAEGVPLEPTERVYEGLLTGIWLLAVRKSVVDSLVERKLGFSEINLHRTAHDLGYLTGRLPNRVYHLGWNAYRDDPRYFEFKVDRILSGFRGDRFSGYALTRQGPDGALLREDHT